MVRNIKYLTMKMLFTIWKEHCDQRCVLIKWGLLYNFDKSMARQIDTDITIKIIFFIKLVDLLLRPCLRLWCIPDGRAFIVSNLVKGQEQRYTLVKESYTDVISYWDWQDPGNILRDFSPIFSFGQARLPTSSAVLTLTHLLKLIFLGG